MRERVLVCCNISGEIKVDFILKPNSGSSLHIPRTTLNRLNDPLSAPKGCRNAVYACRVPGLGVRKHGVCLYVSNDEASDVHELCINALISAASAFSH